jgi:hypothetical protein
MKFNDYKPTENLQFNKPILIELQLAIYKFCITNKTKPTIIHIPDIDRIKYMNEMDSEELYQATPYRYMNIPIVFNNVDKITCFNEL